MKKTMEELQAEKEKLLKLEAKQAEAKVEEDKRKELAEEVAALKHKTGKSGKIVGKIKTVSEASKSIGSKLKKGYSKFQDFADKYG